MKPFDSMIRLALGVLIFSAFVADLRFGRSSASMVFTLIFGLAYAIWAMMDLGWLGITRLWRRFIPQQQSK